LAAFSRQDVSRSWALTAEFGCLRLERLSGDEEVTGQQLFLPLPADYDYGITGHDKSPETTRAVFGLLPSELEQLVNALRRDDGVVEHWSAGTLEYPTLHYLITLLLRVGLCLQPVECILGGLRMLGFNGFSELLHGDFRFGAHA
jgi:hypothetical protein